MGVLLPVVFYAYEFCVPPPLGIYFLCRLRFVQGRPKTPLAPRGTKKIGGIKFKFGQLILGKIIKIVTTTSHILRLKCTEFDFGWGSALDPLGELIALPSPLAGFKGFYF